MVSRSICPSLSVADLLPYGSGIEAVAVRSDSTMAHDFLFSQTDRVLHVCNNRSPAATSAMPAAGIISRLVTNEGDVRRHGKRFAPHN